MANKTNMTLQNWTNANPNATEPTGIPVQDVAQKSWESVTSQATGSAQLSGVLTLGLFALILYKADASFDVAVATYIPSLFFLGTYGYLPYGSGVVYGTLLAAAALFAWGLYKFGFR